jgi:hypothetical protein
MTGEKQKEKSKGIMMDSSTEVQNDKQRQRYFDGLGTQ